MVHLVCERALASRRTNPNPNPNPDPNPNLDPNPNQRTCFAQDVSCDDVMARALLGEDVGVRRLRVRVRVGVEVGVRVRVRVSVGDGLVRARRLEVTSTA